MIRSTIVTLLAFTLSTAAAAVPAGPARHFSAQDLFGLEVASDPQISPDGRRIAYVRRSNDIMTDRARATIWLVDVASATQTPLVARPGAHTSPRWSRDGTRLAYVSTAEGGGGAQLYVRWMATGATARITGLPDSPASIAWSPDGSRIAYTLTVPDDGVRLGAPLAKPEGAAWAPPLEVISAFTYRRDGGGYVKPGFDHIFVVPADGGAPRQLTFGSVNENGPLAWTPDGRAILFGADRKPDWEANPQDTDLWSLDVASGKLTQITTRAGPDGSPAVSPDGRRIAYVGFDDRHVGYQNAMLYVADRDGLNPRAVTAALDRTVADPVWSRDGRAVYVSYDDRGRTKVARVALDGQVRDIADTLAGSDLDRPYTGGAFSVSDTGVVAFTSGSGVRPADVAIAGSGGPRRLTRLNEELLAGKVLGTPRKLPVTAFDKRAIDAWLVLPPDADPTRRYPLILEIHGGPYSAYGDFFSTDDQLYAAAGYAVLYVNPRGSTSYGEDFASQIDKAYPGRDYDDLMSAVDAAIADGHVDPGRLFVTGGSGGGVLTAWIVGKTDRFRAAATQKPVIDWTSFVLTADMTNFFARYWFGRYPWEDPQGYWARSPLSLVGNVKTPTLVVVGAEDYRTPVSEAEQYYAALRLRGVPTALVKVPEASHGGIAARPSQSAAKANAILTWFGRYDGATAR